MNNCVDDSFEPLSSLEQYSLDEINLLEVIDPNDLNEWIEDQSGNIPEEQDSTSIDPDDLEEWIELMSCEDEEELLECLLEDDFKEYNNHSNINNSFNENASQIRIIDNISTEKVNSTSAIKDQIAQYQNKLEVSMRKTELSRLQFLTKKRCSLPPPLNPSALNKNLIDFVVGKRKSLTSDLEESRKRLRMFQPDNHILPHTAFFTGRRTSLTPELEKSRNHLKMFGGFKAQHLPTTQLSDCGQPALNNSNNALMA